MVESDFELPWRSPRQKACDERVNGVPFEPISRGKDPSWLQDPEFAYLRNLPRAQICALLRSPLVILGSPAIGDTSDGLIAKWKAILHGDADWIRN